MIVPGPFENRSGSEGSMACIAGGCENGLFFNPRFRAAVEEMEALGLRVDETPRPGSRPYGVLTGHSGSRWWLVPLEPRAVNISSLALIQPMRSGARVLRQVAVLAGTFGLPWYGLGQRLHISGNNGLARVFGSGFMHCAFFTGTASPHRKLVAQLMDRRGAIRGYAKVGRAPAVHALLANEAAVMREIRGFDMRFAIVPNLLLHEIRDGTAILVTDTTKTRTTRCIRRLTDLHLGFVDELAELTASSRMTSKVALLHGVAAHLQDMGTRLPAEWLQRLRHALDILATREELIAPKGLSHGDFTPWNIFPHEKRLCVIDWEYANDGYPADYDLIHFLFALSSLGNSPPQVRCNEIHRTLTDALGRSIAEADARLLAYLASRAFFLAGRLPRSDGMALRWEGDHEIALMMDALLAASRRRATKAA